MLQMQTAISTAQVIKPLHRKPLLSLHCEKGRAFKPYLTCMIKHLIKSIGFIPSGEELPGNIWKEAGRSKTHSTKAQQRLLILGKLKHGWTFLSAVVELFHRRHRSSVLCLCAAVGYASCTAQDREGLGPGGERDSPEDCGKSSSRPKCR